MLIAHRSSPSRIHTFALREVVIHSDCRSFLIFVFISISNIMPNGVINIQYTKSSMGKGAKKDKDSQIVFVVYTICLSYD